MRRTSSALLLAALPFTNALQPSCSRRAALSGALAAVLPPTAAFASQRADLLTDPSRGCIFGEGEGCAGLAVNEDGSKNELILKLQQKSRDNKEKNEIDLFEKTNAMLGYDDYMIASDKVMVRVDAKGYFKALTTEEYYAAKKAGRLTPGDNGVENLDFVPKAEEAVKATGRSYEDIKALVKAGKVDGIIFKAPSGMTALAALSNSKEVVPLTFDAKWKREEFFNLCEKSSVSNNLKDLLAGNDILAGR